ncbi:MAG: fumarylacetoacetate hydrolase family protein [Polaromonas sp.]|uniref:fumarylacetoacetate hydrolase family protein n=1 Tax=Polaromonas sp. TaxID=1869339 RepID=UPI002488934F|nr:fumarylacetoacetate hydrolase family protein [Polaromonas sp.]MDI1269224.1 fumarylacetoacetate hydrolase family protein [Polaromonas sp.]
MKKHLALSHTLPQDSSPATLIGRVWSADAAGPILVRVTTEGVFDISSAAVTCSELLNMSDAVGAVADISRFPRLGDTRTILLNSEWNQAESAMLRFDSPCDLQAVKASGVTFVASMLERVIEEQAQGDAGRAEAIRASIAQVIGENLPAVKPGSTDAQKLKALLISQDMWSQYLEVGIGPDAEIFTKAQPLSSVGTGSEVGIHPKSEWNNPEPEIVLAVNRAGRIVGATLGNDVNLRDFEGRSALLLGKAKDNNGSCAIGPFIRLFDDSFSLDDVRRCELSVEVCGEEGFILQGKSSMTMISRDPEELVEHAMGPVHQYPDGMMLFLGTMFSPTADRLSPGQGFTHVVGDIVSITTPMLGTLVNRVNHSDKIAPWTFGIAQLMRSLSGRRLI